MRDYGRGPVLAGLDLAVGDGEMVAVMGRSGSGKTSLLNLVGALDRPDRGHVTVAGVELAGASEGARSRARATLVGTVFQEPRLLPHLSCRGNVALAAAFTPGGRHEAWERAGALLERVGLGWARELPPRQLSGGERQRVGLARALFAAPRVLLCDEVTAQLDEATAAGVVELICRLRREDRLTVLAATHDRALAGACDRRLWLAAGRLAESLADVAAGTP